MDMGHAMHDQLTCLKPVAAQAVNDGLRAVKHGFGAVHNGTTILVMTNVLHRGNAIAERFSAVADGTATRNFTNNVKPVLNFGSSNVNVRNVKVHFIEWGYDTSKYFIF